MPKAEPRTLPLAMCAHSVRAFLKDEKIESRRVVEPQPVWIDPEGDELHGWWSWICRDGSGEPSHYLEQDFDTEWGEIAAAMVETSRLQPGDRFYLNERISFEDLVPDDRTRGAMVMYHADGTTRLVEIPKRVKMPKRGTWRGRVLPVEWARPERGLVKSVRVERLQDITEAGARAEGYGPDFYPVSGERRFVDPLQWFRGHWNRINGKRDGRAYRWDKNPVVRVYTFAKEG